MFQQVIVKFVYKYRDSGLTETQKSLLGYYFLALVGEVSHKPIHHSLGSWECPEICSEGYICKLHIFSCQPESSIGDLVTH